MLRLKAKKLNETLKETKDTLVEELSSRINEEEEISYFSLPLYLKFMQLYKESSEYIAESSALIDSMNEKIDEMYAIINKKNKKGS